MIYNTYIIIKMRFLKGLIMIRFREDYTVGMGSFFHRWVHVSHTLSTTHNEETLSQHVSR